VINFWQAVALGALQGVTEFLPVSSSGHLVLLREVLAVAEVPVLFDVLLHLATLAATAVVFRARLGRLIAAAVDLLRPQAQRRSRGDERRLLGLLLLCTVVTGGIGMAFGAVGLPREPRFVAVMLLVTAAVLLAARFLRGPAAPGPAAPGTAAPRTAAAPGTAWKPRWPWALLIGVVQGLAVIPGISRSGATIAAGVLAGADRETAADFSFLASVPAILGAVVVSLPDLSALEAAVDPSALIAGMAVSFAAGWLALTVLLRIVRRGRLHLFALYLIPVGIIGLTVL
jgi:undecaprenyl-diphosphatase